MLLKFRNLFNLLTEVTLALVCVALPLFLLAFLLPAAGVNVRNYGARGNGTHDDTLAVQNAMRACPPGGTVDFPAGNYPVSGLAAGNQCTYAGAPGAILRLTAPNRFIFDISQHSGLRITGLGLDGGNIGGAIIAQGNSQVQDIQVDNCEFRNVQSTAVFPANIAFVSTWGLINGSVHDNRFINVAAGVWFTTVQNVSILNNSFVNVTQGDAIYIAPNPVNFPSGDNLRIAGNSGVNLARMGIELFRPDPTNGSTLTAPVIENNVFVNWTGTGGMGMSITHGDGATVRGNQLMNAGPVQTIGIEVIVANGRITGNTVVGGFAEGIALGGLAGDQVTGNYVSGSTDNGIILSCDNGFSRCVSRNSTITGNTIVNPRLIGIKLDNDWTGSLVARNTIIRSAGYWADDSTISFTGIHQSPAPGPGTIDSNLIEQDTVGWPAGYWFQGIKLNSSMTGSAVTNNVVRSATPGVFGAGLADNTGTATVGWVITGNQWLNVLVWPR